MEKRANLFLFLICKRAAVSTYALGWDRKKRSKEKKQKYPRIEKKKQGVINRRQQPNLESLCSCSLNSSVCIHTHTYIRACVCICLVCVYICIYAPMSACVCIHCRRSLLSSSTTIKTPNSTLISLLWFVVFSLVVDLPGEKKKTKKKKCSAFINFFHCY